MTECLDQLRDNRSAINSAGIMDNSSVIAQGESGTRERELFLRVEPFVRRVSSHLDFNVAEVS